MIQFSHSIIRHLTIDRLLCNWKEKEVTITDMVDACTDAVKSYFPEDTDKNFRVSLRTIQLDIQNMRSKTKGYSAPIIVYQNKFYRYKNPAFTITNVKIKGEIAENLEKLIKVLHLYESFSCNESLRKDLSILEKHLKGIKDEANDITDLEFHNDTAEVKEENTQGYVQLDLFS